MLRRLLLARARRGTALLTTSTALALLVSAGAADASIPFDLGAYDGAALRFGAPFGESAGARVAGDCEL